MQGAGGQWRSFPSASDLRLALKHGCASSSCPFTGANRKPHAPIQYVPHVFAIICRCRRERQKTHPEDIEADPVPGELLVYQKGMKRVAVLGGCAHVRRPETHRTSHPRADELQRAGCGFVLQIRAALSLPVG